MLTFCCMLTACRTSLRGRRQKHWRATVQGALHVTKTCVYICVIWVVPWLGRIIRELYSDLQHLHRSMPVYLSWFCRYNANSTVVVSRKILKCACMERFWISCKCLSGESNLSTVCCNLFRPKLFTNGTLGEKDVKIQPGFNGLLNFGQILWG